MKSQSRVTPQCRQVGFSWVGVWLNKGDICQKILYSFQMSCPNQASLDLDLTVPSNHMYHRWIFHRTQKCITVLCFIELRIEFCFAARFLFDVFPVFGVFAEASVTQVSEIFKSLGRCIGTARWFCFVFFI